MIPASTIRGLYAITPDCSDTARLLNQVKAVLAGGTRLLQYRNKTASAALQLEQATALRGLTREFAATLVINDDPQLAAKVDADGVHLGATDGGLPEARALLGEHKIIGISCYNHPALARKAVVEGADYVAFGAFFPSAIKPDAAVADIELLRRMRAELDVPLVAIGGITVQNAALLLEAGADAVAVISALFDAEDIQTAAHKFSELFFRNPAS